MSPSPSRAPSPSIAHEEPPPSRSPSRTSPKDDTLPLPPASGADPQDAASSPPAITYGDDYRLVTLLPERVLVHVTWDEYVATEKETAKEPEAVRPKTPEEATAPEPKAAAPEPRQPPKPPFSDAAVVVVPWTKPLPSDVAHDRKNAWKGKIEWDIALRNPASHHEWRMWRMDTGELSAEEARASSEANGGIILGRITAEQGYARAVTHFQNPPSISITHKPMGSLEWTSVVSETLRPKLRSFELSRTDIDPLNDGAQLRELPKTDVTSVHPIPAEGLKGEWLEWLLHTRPNDFRRIEYLVEHEGFTLVDQHLIDARCKWTAEAFPPCTLKLSWRSVEQEYYVLTSDDLLDRPWFQVPYRITVEDPTKECQCAVVLLPDSNSYGEVLWKLGLVDRKSKYRRARTAFVQEVSSGKGRTVFQLTNKVYSTFNHMDSDTQGGILIGYCSDGNIPAVRQAFEDEPLARDTKSWAFRALQRAVVKGLLIAPDQKSPLGTDWIAGLETYLEAALRKKVAMKRLEETGQQHTIKKTISRFLQDEDSESNLVDERYLQLARECLFPVVAR